MHQATIKLEPICWLGYIYIYGFTALQTLNKTLLPPTPPLLNHQAHSMDTALTYRHRTCISPRQPRSLGTMSTNLSITPWGRRGRRWGYGCNGLIFAEGLPHILFEFREARPPGVLVLSTAAFKEVQIGGFFDEELVENIRTMREVLSP